MNQFSPIRNINMGRDEAGCGSDNTNAGIRCEASDGAL